MIVDENKEGNVQQEHFDIKENDIYNDASDSNKPRHYVDES